MCADLSSRATETTYKKLSNSRSLDKNMTRYPMLTNLAGRTKNFGDFKRNAYLPVFEAFVNSIHAIDDRKKILNESNYVGNIQVRVIRGKGQANATDGKVERKRRDTKMNTREYLKKYKPMNIEQLEAAKKEIEEKLEIAVNDITEKQYHGTLEEEYQAEEVRNELHKELSALESVLNVKRWM